MDAKAIAGIVARTLGWAAQQCTRPVIRMARSTDAPSVMIVLENDQVFRLTVEEITE